MKWLAEFVDVDVPVEKLAELLDLSGTKVEAIHRPGASIGGVVVAQVLEITQHPNADTLTLVDVRTNEGEPQRVVCGAKNFAVGDLVPLAQVGARLAEMEITERKIRGQTSRGMLCSAAELGVSADHSGILVLPRDAAPGDDVVGLLGLNDTILELEITPNRPDCMSVLGVAREVSALLRNDLRRPEVKLGTAAVTNPVSVDVQDPVGCPRYLARYIEDVKVERSPAWVTARLLSVGVRAVSNVVDVTNLVLFELGQPLHAFDAAKVSDAHIVVRRGRRGERMTTLDGHERRLHPDDLLIAEKKAALGIAGVMGGGDSEVSDQTTSVILESAYFQPESISFTGRRHGLRTEASARFERGTDPEMVTFAADRAASLIAELAGGRVAGDLVDRYPSPIRRATISLRPRRVEQILGSRVAADQQMTYLRSLELVVTESDGLLQVEVPTFRPDLVREIDLVEEVGRLAGFDHLPNTLPPGRTGRLDRSQVAERALRRLLAALGFHEAWTSSFMAESELTRLGVSAADPAARAVRLANPTSEESRCLRTTLLPGLLRSVALNERQRAPGVALFELARVYEASGERLPQEAVVLAGVVSGARRLAAWSAPEQAWDFFHAKGIVESVFASFGLPAPAFSQVQGLPFHPTRAAAVTVDGTAAGAVGELHPEVLTAWEIERPVIAFELALAPVLAALPERTKVQELGRFPSNFFDIAVVVNADLVSSEVEAIIREVGAPEVVNVRLFDVYEGDQIPEGKKSLAFALELRSKEATVTDAVAATVRDRIVAALAARLGAGLRR